MPLGPLIRTRTIRNFQLPAARGGASANIGHGGGQMTIGANSYRWDQHYKRQSPASSVEQTIDEALDFAATGGIESWEPCWDSAEKFDIYSKALPKHGLEMASVYKPCNLLQSDNDVEIERVIALCLTARELGTHLAATNPDPVNWNNTPKSDHLVRYQTASLET